MGGLNGANRPITQARPAFEIDGRAEVRLDVDLQRLDTSEDEDGVSSLEAVFTNWGRATNSSAPGFLYFDGGILELGKEITVSMDNGEDRATVFSGIITAIEGVYPELREPEIIVRAEDRLMWLRMQQRSRLHAQASDQDAAEAVCRDHGLQADARTDGPTHEQLWQVNQSDLMFLRERARAVGARLGLEDRRLVFRTARGDAGAEPIQLSRLNRLLRFEVSADLAHQRTKVCVNGYSVDDKRAIHEAAEGRVADSEKASPSGRTGPSILDALGVEAVEELHAEPPFTTGEAGVMARSRMLARARRFVTGRGVTNGSPTMRVGSVVEILDCGPWFGGAYHVAGVRHSFEPGSGYRTHFQAERVDLGESR